MQMKLWVKTALQYNLENEHKNGNRFKIQPFKRARDNTTLQMDLWMKTSWCYEYLPLPNELVNKNRFTIYNLANEFVNEDGFVLSDSIDSVDRLGL